MEEYDGQWGKTMEIEVGYEAVVTVKGLGSNGEGIAEIDGMKIFVKYVLPGEQARIRIDKIHKSYAAASMLELLSTSPERVQPACPAYGRCGGCDLLHLTRKAELELKRKIVTDAFARLGGMRETATEPVLAFDSASVNMDGSTPAEERSPFHYRNKAQYALQFDETASETRIGFFAEQSHTIVPIDSCLLQKQGNRQILAIISGWMQAFKHNAAGVDGVVVRTAEKTAEIMVGLRARDAKIPNVKILIEQIKLAEPMLKSVVVYIPVYAGKSAGKSGGKDGVKSAAARAVVGMKSTVIWGEDAIFEELKGLRFRISPNSFFQVNTHMAEVLYEEIAKAAELSEQETVFDLYCGTGSIALFLAADAQDVIGIDTVEEAVSDAKHNAKLNEISNATFLCDKAEKALANMRRDQIDADVIILDPPRKGCHPTLIDTIHKTKTPRIVMVSCEPATLARDVSSLCRDGHYAVTRVQPVDMFPGTAKIEAVVLLERRNP